LQPTHGDGEGDDGGFGIEGVTPVLLQSIFQVNTIAPIMAIKASHHWLHMSHTRTGRIAKFVVLTMPWASISGMNLDQGLWTCLGLPVLNYAARCLHLNMEKVVSMVMCPRWSGSYRSVRVEGRDACLEGVMQMVDTADRMNRSGRFWLFNGTQVSW
jgi:hypothetical protein